MSAFLIGLVLACLLPGVIGATALFVSEYRQGRVQQQKDTFQMARALAQAVDNQILRVEALAHGLATATSLARGDLASFHAQARQTLERAKLATSVVLVDRSGWQILNTLKEFGEPLPFNGNPKLVNRVFETGEPAVSDLYIGAVLRRPIMTVAVPVIIDGHTDYVLITPIQPDKFAAILSTQGVPADWVVSILDSTGTIAARTRATEAFVGKRSAPDLLRPFTAANEGTVETVSAEGVPVRSIFTHSPVTNWGVCIDIPSTDLDSPLIRQLSIMALGVVALFGVGLGLAGLIGSRIARSFQSLVAPAVALGSGETVSFPPIAVKEAAALAGALDKAAKLLKTRDAALQEATRTLRASEAKYRSLFSNMTEAFALGEPVLDAQGRPVDILHQEVNDAFYQQTGIPRSVVGRPLREYLPRLEQFWIDRIAAVALTGEPDRIDDYNADTRRHYEAYVFCPQPGRYAILFRDVTRIRQDEERLRESERRYRALIQASSQVLYRMSPDWSEMWQLQGGSFIADTEKPNPNWLQEYIHPDDQARVREAIGESIRTGSVFELEHRVRRMDGTLGWTHSRAVPLRNAAGGIVEWFGAASDISARKQAEADLRALTATLERRVAERTAELERTNEALLHSNMELQHFAHAAAHDLQTPLRSIAGFAQLMQQATQSHGDEQVSQWAALVLGNTKRLQVLIQGLLAYTRLDAQGLPHEPVDLQEVGDQVIASLAVLIRESGAQVQCRPLPTLPVDRIQMAQVFQNLIENGIKYNQSGAPRIDIAAEMKGGEWVFSVTDNGIGIDPKHFERIFGIFQRLHTYHQVPGSGIGLALCRRIVERHGGRLWVESQPGRGSAFLFTLPAAGGAPDIP